MTHRTLLSYRDVPIRQDWRTLYTRYRIGRIKHQYWLWNRKRSDAVIDSHDAFILQNCQPGMTAFFASSAYYLKDLWPEIEVIEMHPVVSTFRSDVHICQREHLGDLPFKADNFAVVNNRADQWFDEPERDQLLDHYLGIMNPGCRFFYSFRDTQIPCLNRLTTDLESYWKQWATRLANSHDLHLCWYDINFPKRGHDISGLENPDTTNGNLKFVFTFKHPPCTIVS
jgi:hypothetical protein